MEPERAALELRKLRLEAVSPEIQRSGPDHKSWKARVDAVMQAGLGTESETLRQFRSLRYHPGYSFGGPDEAQRNVQYFAARVADAAGLIDAAIYELELNDETSQGSRVAPAGPIFVVHGHHDGRKYELMRLLDRTVDLQAIVLHEQPSKGATILEKFERHAQSASFAVVLLTGDDEGRIRGSDESLAPRGRQNVILELGVFIGLLGRDRVIVLKDSDVEEPSDLSGLVYISLDEAGAWRTELLKELAAANVNVDFNRIP